jgi:hypothetical protein
MRYFYLLKTRFCCDFLRQSIIRVIIRREARERESITLVNDDALVRVIMSLRWIGASTLGMTPSSFAH